MTISPPAVSVIIPARNAAATLPRTLQALDEQNLAAPYEVIVVDDGSEDATAAIAARPGVELIRQPPEGPGPARNRGVAAAKAEALAFTDADCRPEAGWLREGLAALEAADLVQGFVYRDPAVSLRLFDRSVGITSETGLYECANLFVRRELFEAVGGFEDWLRARLGKPLAEDVWFGWKVRRAGGSSAFAAEARVVHEVFRRRMGAYVADRARFVYFPAIVSRIPELRSDFLYGRVFLNGRTAAFDLALAGVGMATALGRAWPAVAGAPYAWQALRAAARWGRHAPRALAGHVGADIVGFAALVVGSLRFRAPVL